MHFQVETSVAICRGNLCVSFNLQRRVTDHRYYNLRYYPDIYSSFHYAVNIHFYPGEYSKSVNLTIPLSRDSKEVFQKRMANQNPVDFYEIWKINDPCDRLAYGSIMSVFDTDTAEKATTGKAEVDTDKDFRIDDVHFWEENGSYFITVVATLPHNGCADFSIRKDDEPEMGKRLQVQANKCVAIFEIDEPNEGDSYTVRVDGATKQVPYESMSDEPVKDESPECSGPGGGGPGGPG